MWQERWHTHSNDNMSKEAQNASKGVAAMSLGRRKALILFIGLVLTVYITICSGVAGLMIGVVCTASIYYIGSKDWNDEQDK